MRKTLCAAMIALGALMLVPAETFADHRFGTDRGSRYYRGGHHGGFHGYHGGRSRSYFDISIGFGSHKYYRGGGYHSSFRFGTYPRHYGYKSYYRPAPLVVYSPPVVYAPPPPVIYSPPPVVYYSAPRPVYTSSYYYSSGGYYCGR